PPGRRVQKDGVPAEAPDDLVGWSMRRSAGFAPLRILSTYWPCADCERRAVGPEWNRSGLGNVLSIRLFCRLLRVASSIRPFSFCSLSFLGRSSSIASRTVAARSTAGTPRTSPSDFERGSRARLSVYP